MKILLLAPQPFYQGRGTPIAVKMLAEDLQGAGHHVDLLVFHEGEDVPFDGVRLFRIPAIPGIRNIGPGFSLKKIICDFFLLIKAIHLFRKNRYDVCHAVEESIFIALLLKLIFHKPCVYDVDSWMSDQIIDKYPRLSFLRPFLSFWERLAVKGSDASVVVCKALQEKVQDIGVEQPLLRLEDVCMLEEVNDSFESLRKVVGLPGPLLLYVGNLERYQGIDLLLESFALLLQECKDASLVVIGGTESTKEKYCRQAEELAIAERVFFIGPRPLRCLSMFLRQADLLVSPRLDGENTPMKIYSYMGSGRAIVATKIRSHTQVLDDSVAFLAEPDSTSVKDACLKALSDDNRRQTVAQCAAKKVVEEYSRDAFRRKITDFYKELSHVWNLRI